MFVFLLVQGMAIQSDSSAAHRAWYSGWAGREPLMSDELRASNQAWRWLIAKEPGDTPEQTQERIKANEVRQQRAEWDEFHARSRIPGRVLGAWAVVCIGVGSGLVAGFWPRR